MIKTTFKNLAYKEFFTAIYYIPTNFKDISYSVLKITKDTIEKETEFESLLSFEKIKNMLGMFKFL